MKRRKKKISLKRIFFAIGVLVMCSVSLPVYATEITEELEIVNEIDEANEDRFSYGSPWMEGADQSIYSNSIDATEEEQEIEPDDPGIVEKNLAELIRNAASSLISLLEDNLGASLDKIIYGRVGSGKPNSVNIYSFELRSGNPYGVTASVCYSVIRSIAFVFLGISFVFILAKASWTGHTAQNQEQIKTSIYSIAMKFAALTLMPYVFDVGLYIRDVLLYGIKEVTGLMITNGATLSLSKAFLLNAEQSGRFIDALMYLSTVLLTLYFAFIYVAVAIDLLICFVAFPIMCVLQTQKKDLLGNWGMNVLSDMLTPVLDAVLLLVPLLTSLMLADVIKGIAIIQMIMCMLIIPSRNRIKALLGIQSNERGGILGAMAMLSLGRVLAGKVKGAFGAVSDIRSDLEKSRMHKEMSDVDEQEKESLLGGYSANEKGKGLSDESLGSDTNDNLYQDEFDDSVFENPADEGNGSVADEWNFAEGEKDGLDTMEDVDSEQILEDGPEKDTVLMDDGRSAQEHTEANDDDAISGQDMGVEKRTSIDSAVNRNEALRNLDKAMEKKQDTIDGLRSQKAYYQNEEKRKARQMLDYERGSDEYRELERQRADAAVKVAETEQKIAGQMRDMNQLRNESKTIKGSQNGPTPTPFDEARAEIISKRANINNFEQPEFKNTLSNAQMQKLYKQRAMTNLAKGAGAVAGAATGAVLLGGGSLFMQPSTAAMAGAAGIVGGSAVGSSAVDIGTAGVQLTGKAVAAGRRIYETEVQSHIATAASGVDFDEVYEQSPETVVPPVSDLNTSNGRSSENQPNIVREVKVMPGTTSTVSSEVENVQATGLSEEVLHQTIMVEVERDSAEAIKRVISSSGGIKTSSAIQALKNANIETEKYVATIRETEGITLTPKQETQKRIELQTQFMTDEVMKKLGTQPDYEKGTEKYNAARELVQQKVQAIIEKQNKDIF